VLLLISVTREVGGMGSWVVRMACGLEPLMDGGAELGCRADDEDDGADVREGKGVLVLLRAEGSSTRMSRRGDPRRCTSWEEEAYLLFAMC
jgi:hypothetical protein